MNESDHHELIEWLTARGHSPPEIEKILDRVRRYEVETQADSIMDSIGAGNIDLSSLIDEALGNS